MITKHKNLGFVRLPVCSVSVGCQYVQLASSTYAAVSKHEVNQALTHLRNFSYSDSV